MDMGANVAKVSRCKVSREYRPALGFVSFSSEAAKRKPSMLGRLVLAFENFFKRTGTKATLRSHTVQPYYHEQS